MARQGSLITTAFNSWAGTKTRTVTVPAQTIDVQYSVTSASAGSVNNTVDALRLKVQVVKDRVLRRLQFSLPNGNTFDASPAGTLLRNASLTTGVGTPAGSVNAGTGDVQLQSWPAAVANMPRAVNMLQTPVSDGPTAPHAADMVAFRTAAAPLRPASVQVLGTLYDGTDFDITSDLDGKFNAARVKGRVNYSTGLVELWFVDPANVVPTAAKVDLAFLGLPGVGELPVDLCLTAGMVYNAVAYTYLPLDANILGLDPVRLPQDGRVPVFKAGRVVVVHNTVKRTPQAVTNGLTVNCGRVRLARIRVFGADGLEITSGFSKSLDAGTITFTNVAGYSQPVTIEHRVEDEALCAEAQITGDIRLTRPLTHDYPVPGTYVSSAMIIGTLQAAAADGFGQLAWTDVWADVRIGAPLLAAYNQTANPIMVTNAGAITERWALIFTSSITFNVVGEASGQIMTGDTGSTLSPVNAATGVPLFTINPAGWGGGWVAGNVFRFNTSGANFPMWLARTVLQSASAPPGTDQATVSIRGDIDQ